MNLTLFMQVLPKAGLGWLGVFAVTIIIVAAVELLEHFTNRKKQRQYRIILSADTASEVRHLPERCLSRKAGIVRCCLKCPICRTTLKPFPLAEICRRWGFLKEGRSMARPQCGKSLS